MSFDHQTVGHKIMILRMVGDDFLFTVYKHRTRWTRWKHEKLSFRRLIYSFTAADYRVVVLEDVHRVRHAFLTSCDPSPATLCYTSLNPLKFVTLWAKKS